MADMDKIALENSEIFTEYAKNFEIKEDSGNELLLQLKDIEAKVNNNKKLKEAVASVQKKILEDSKYRESLHPDFVSGILLINIKE